MKQTGMKFEYCGISNINDFHNYESVIQFTYKIVNTKKQISKLCDFITDYRGELHHEWYMKIRPDVKLLENIDFGALSVNAINARARVYNGPKKIRYGMSVGGEGCWQMWCTATYSDRESGVILDDMLYVFHKNMVDLNIFEKTTFPAEITEDEYELTKLLTHRNAPLNVVGINLLNCKHMAYSGHIP
jgi:hypothetical protein